MKKINESELEYRNVKEQTGPKYLMRGPNIDWGVIRFTAGQQMGPHGHNETEEIFFILEGEGDLIVNDEPHPYRPGDAFYLEPKEKHDVKAKTETRMVFIKHPFLPDDKVTY
ncbi:MAG: cupin domain-containing protein [Promethearchaeota archaeon]